jgi:hypothetical protein
VAIALTVKGAIRQRRLLYIVLSALMALIVAVGFWPTYYGPLVRLTLAQPPLIHVHAIVFTGWLALFSTQAVLAANGRLRWHVRLGRIGIAYGVLLVIVGLTTGVCDQQRCGVKERPKGCCMLPSSTCWCSRASSVRRSGSGGDPRCTRD